MQCAERTRGTNTNIREERSWDVVAVIQEEDVEGLPWGWLMINAEMNTEVGCFLEVEPTGKQLGLGR